MSRIKMLTVLLSAFAFLVTAGSVATLGDDAKKPAKKRGEKKLDKKRVTDGQRRAPGLLGGVRDTVDRKDAVETILLLSPRGPVVVKVMLTRDGRPHRMATEKLVDEMLKAADTDKDGKPTWKEVAKAPPYSVIRFGRFQFRNPKQIEAYVLRRYDFNKNGLLDRVEARQILTQSNRAATFQVNRTFNRFRQPNLTKILDVDGDGRVSKKERSAAEKRLKSRDANDDDILQTSEVGGGRLGGNSEREIVKERRRQQQLPAPGHLLGPAADTQAIFKALKAKYAKKGDIKAGTFPLFPKLVKQLDANNNGRLDAGEVAGFNRVKPHVVVRVNLGETDRQPEGVTVVSLAPQLGKVSAGSKPATSAGLSLPSVSLQFTAQNVPRGGRRTEKAMGRFETYLQVAIRTIARYDADNNGIIEKKELVGGERAGFLKAQFDRWDADKNGKVTAKELEADYKLQETTTLSRISASVVEQGPSLFAALDVSGDNRISLREMRSATKRLAEIDKNKDGKFAAQELPGKIEVVFNLGRGLRRNPRATPAPAGGPKWFIGMDRNGDGDVTPKEFVGTSAQFKKIDTNGDGFIERKEAEAVKLPKKSAKN